MLRRLWIPKIPSGLSTQVFSVREIIIVSTMTPFFIAFLALVASTFRTRAALQAEIVVSAIRSPSVGNRTAVVRKNENRGYAASFTRRYS
jgi:hypothetical protein